MANDPHSMNDVLDAIEALADKQDRVSLGDVIEATGERSHGPLLLIPALIDISPIGAIPGLPTVLAAIIVLTAVQIAFGRTHPWLPGFLLRRSAKASTVSKVAGKARKPARFADRWLHGRLMFLTRGPFLRIAAVACIVLACSVPPLEFIPLATTLPMAAIAAFGLGLMVRDGLVMLIAIALAVGAVVAGVGLIGSAR